MNWPFVKASFQEDRLLLYGLISEFSVKTNDFKMRVDCSRSSFGCLSTDCRDRRSPSFDKKQAGWFWQPWKPFLRPSLPKGLMKRKKKNIVKQSKYILIFCLSLFLMNSSSKWAFKMVVRAKSVKGSSYFFQLIY